MNIDEKLEESIENKYVKDDKGKNKMELTIEESVYILKRKDFNTYVEDKAIETLLTAYEKEKEKNKKIEKELEKHIKFCEQEAEGSLHNEICLISLRFNKKLLNILNEEE